MSNQEFKVVYLTCYPLPEIIPPNLKNSKYPFVKMKEMDMFEFPGGLSQAKKAAMMATKAYDFHRQYEARVFIDKNTNEVKVGIWRLRMDSK